MKKIFVVSMIILIGCLSLNAQIEINAIGGIGYSNINIKRENPTVIGIKGIPSYRFGVALRKPFKENFNLTADLVFIRKGYKQSIGIAIVELGELSDSLTKFNIASYNLEVPILMEFESKFNKMTVFYGLGPYFSYGIAGKIDLSIKSPSTDLKYSENIRWRTYFGLGNDLGVRSTYNYGYSAVKRFDYGISTRFGVRFKSVLINMQYDYGLANLMWEYRKYEKMNNHNLGLSVAITLNKTKNLP